MLVPVIIVLALVFFPSCSNSKKSSSSGGAPTGGGGGNGTGTGTGTGGTGTGTGGSGTGGGGSPGDADTVDLEIIIGIDEPMSSLEHVKSRIETINALYWKSTDGQSYFQKVTIIDNSKEQGLVNYPKGRVYMSNVDGKVLGDDTPGAGCPGGLTMHDPVSGIGMIYVIGQFTNHIFLHEWGHFFMNRQNEEYSCSGCWMRGQNGTPQDDYYCDASNCKVGNPCWENNMLVRFTHWEHPASFDPNPPASQFDIQDY